jgi:hypothetical protein
VTRNVFLTATKIGAIYIANVESTERCDPRQCFTAASAGGRDLSWKSPRRPPAAGPRPPATARQHASPNPAADRRQPQQQQHVGRTSPVASPQEDQQQCTLPAQAEIAPHRIELFSSAPSEEEGNIPDKKKASSSRRSKCRLFSQYFQESF